MSTALCPPKTEDYAVVHAYYTDGGADGTVDGGTIEVAENAVFDDVVKGITKKPAYENNTYTYTSYTVDLENKVITLTYVRTFPKYDYSVIYNANDFVCDGYKLISWNTEADGSGKAYAPPIMLH